MTPFEYSGWMIQVLTVAFLRNILFLESAKTPVSISMTFLGNFDVFIDHVACCSLFQAKDKHM